MSVNWKDLAFVSLTYACPEQYDVLYSGETVGYLRLRQGVFRVHCPDIGGDVVYEAEPEGDGLFNDDEREYYLACAAQAIAIWCDKHLDFNPVD